MTKTLISLVIIMHFMGGCKIGHEFEMNLNDLYEQNEVFYSKNTKGIYSGNVIARYPDGKTEKLFTVKNGKIDGKYTEFWPDGKIRMETYVIDGIQHGDIFVRMGDGETRKGSLKNGKLDGKLAKYYPNGKLYETSFYKNGILDGEFILYHENGIISEKGIYVNDKKNGQFTYYDDKENVTKTIIFKDDIAQSKGSN